MSKGNDRTLLERLQEATVSVTGIHCRVVSRGKLSYKKVKARYLRTMRERLGLSFSVGEMLEQCYSIFPTLDDEADRVAVMELISKVCTLFGSLEANYLRKAERTMLSEHEYCEGVLNVPALRLGAYLCGLVRENLRA